MALKAGELAGLTVPPAVFTRAEKFVTSCETKGGGYSYTPGGETLPTMTAAGMLCRLYLGTPVDDKRIIEGADYLFKVAPPEKSKNLYYEYYANQVMHHLGGDYWKKWNEGEKQDGLRDILVGRMDAGKDPMYPKQLGSWHMTGLYSTEGRIMGTSLSLLSLEVYYRHIPLHRRDSPKPKD